MRVSPVWSRRVWLSRLSTSAVFMTFASRKRRRIAIQRPGIATGGSDRKVVPPSAAPTPPDLMQAIARRGVEVATAAGATYVDVHLTRVVEHRYHCYVPNVFWQDIELVGIGVRALVNGYWGFAASTFRTFEDVTQLARDAVAQAKTNAKGPPRSVEFAPTPVVTGIWATPIAIDPFSVSIEEKADYIQDWYVTANEYNLGLDGTSELDFIRHERTVATSDGSLITQTCYESAGYLTCNNGAVKIAGTQRRAKGWELFLDAKISEQFEPLADAMKHPRPSPRAKPATVGRYTIVCDGATMASIVDRTLGVATQIDRALGYEANAGGTSFIDDPLAMLGTLRVGSPLVTLTANRSAPAQLATVKWDDEAVAPQDFTLIKDGVLVDFQTTREQASWLAPYYQRRGRPVRSNGCAASETALTTTMQHMPNLSLTPSTADIALQDLIANVTEGILIEEGNASCDWQARGGVLTGAMRQITRGQLGSVLFGGAIRFDTLDFWKNVVVVGGSETQGGVDVTQYALSGREEKGQPAQATSHSVRAAAATIQNQAMVDPTRIV